MIWLSAFYNELCDGCNNNLFKEVIKNSFNNLYYKLRSAGLGKNVSNAWTLIIYTSFWGIQKGIKNSSRKNSYNNKSWIVEKRLKYNSWINLKN